MSGLSGERALVGHRWLVAGIAAAAALLWLAVAPPTPDLAAAVYRAELFAREGFQLYDSAWFGGHHIPGYSLLSPALTALLGVRPAAALAAVASAVLFERLAVGHWGRAGRGAAIWYAIATATSLAIGRVAFGLGVAGGLAALLALQRGRPRLAVLLAVLCAAMSPVAGLFLALAAMATWLARREARAPLAVAAAAGGCVLLVAAVFPEGGRQPCSFGAMAAVVGSCALLLWLIGRHERAIVIGAGLYAAAALVTYAVSTPMGSNISRLGAEFAAPVLLGSLTGRPRAQRLALPALIVVFVALAVWQWKAPVRETLKGIGDASYESAYYAPLIAELEHQGPFSGRVEVPFTRAHWEAVHLAPHFALARGWQTQLDVKYDAILRDRRMTAGGYHDWLRRTAVAFVALPDAPLDGAGLREAQLIRGGLGYLEPVWSDTHWRLFRVSDAVPLATGPARLLAVGPQDFELDGARGSTLVRLRWTPYWTIRGAGCLERAGDDWTRVRLAGPGRVRVSARFSVRGAVTRGSRCFER